MTTSEPKSNEEEISSCFQAARQKLDRVDAEAKEKKTQIVKDLAKDLEGKIRTDSICNEIVHQLHGKVSERLIRRCLDEKYKETHRVENARKQKPHDNTKDLAAQVPLEQEKPKQQIATTQDGKSVTINESCSDTEPVSNRIGPDDNNEAETDTTNQIKSDEPTSCPKTDNFDDTSLLAQNRTDKRIELDIEKCPNCSVLRLHNQELEEALRKATTLSTADALHSPADILDLEFSLPYQYIQQYMAAEYQLGKSKVWFCVKIDIKARKITSVKTGRISES